MPKIVIMEFRISELGKQYIWKWEICCQEKDRKV